MFRIEILSPDKFAGYIVVESWYLFIWDLSIRTVVPWYGECGNQRMFIFVVQMTWYFVISRMGEKSLNSSHRYILIIWPLSSLRLFFCCRSSSSRIITAMLFSLAIAALVGSASSTILWDGRFNDMTSSTDLNNWSWSDEVGPYQYYIVSLTWFQLS